MVGSAFYAIFGRLQYNTSATQEVCAILYGASEQQPVVQQTRCAQLPLCSNRGAMAQSAAERLRRSGQPERIPATAPQQKGRGRGSLQAETCAEVLALIMAGTSLTGLCSVLLGKLGVGKAGSLCHLITVPQMPESAHDDSCHRMPRRRTSKA